MSLIRNYLDDFRAFLDLLANASCELVRTVTYPLYSERRYAPPPVLVIIVYVTCGDQPMSARRDPRTSDHPVVDGGIELRIQTFAGRRPDQARISMGERKLRIFECQIGHVAWMLLEAARLRRESDVLVRAMPVPLCHARHQ